MQMNHEYELDAGLDIFADAAHAVAIEADLSTGRKVGLGMKEIQC